MNAQTYSRLAGTIFAIVAILHLIRALKGTEATLGGMARSTTRLRSPGRHALHGMVGALGETELRQQSRGPSRRFVVAA